MPAIPDQHWVPVIGPPAPLNIDHLGPDLKSIQNGLEKHKVNLYPKPASNILLLKRYAINHPDLLPVLEFQKLINTFIQIMGLHIIQKFPVKSMMGQGRTVTHHD